MRDAGWAGLVAMEVESGGGLGETGKTGGDSLGERVCTRGRMEASNRGFGWLGTSVSKRGHVQTGLGSGERKMMRSAWRVATVLIF